MIRDEPKNLVYTLYLYLYLSIFFYTNLPVILCYKSGDWFKESSRFDICLSGRARLYDHTSLLSNQIIIIIVRDYAIMLCYYQNFYCYTMITNTFFSIIVKIIVFF